MPRLRAAGALLHPLGGANSLRSSRRPGLTVPSPPPPSSSISLSTTGCYGRSRKRSFRSRVGGSILALTASAAAACGGGSSGSAPAERANLLLITVSSLRADHLGIYGYPRNQTPRLDLFGASGAVFLEATTPWPETGRAAAAVLTGRDPARITRGEPARLLDSVGLGGTLRGAGYRTLAAVSHPALAAELGFARSFDEFREHWNAPPAEATAAIAAFGAEIVVADSEQPFFLWLHFSAPAPPHEPPDGDLAAVAADGFTPSGPRFRPGAAPARTDPAETGYGEAVDRYDAAIRSVDRAVGRVLDALAGGPAAGRTLAAIAGLHGESLGEHAPVFTRPLPLFRETLRAPLLLGWPGGDASRVPSGVRFGSAVGLADISPTALALIGVPAPETPPEGVIGKSLVPALRGEDPRPHRRLYAQSENGLFGIFDGRLRMLRIPVPGQEAPLFALFDLTRDPEEADNRYPAAGPSLEPLRAQLETRRIRTVAWRQENERGAAAEVSVELAAALSARTRR